MDFGLKIQDPRGNQHFKESIKWCQDNFGESGPHDTAKNSTSEWTWREHFWFSTRSGEIGYGAVYFRNEADALAYVLKWA